MQTPPRSKSWPSRARVLVFLKLGLVLAMCVSCTPALVAVCVGVSAAGVTAAVVVENSKPADAGAADARKSSE